MAQKGSTRVILRLNCTELFYGVKAQQKKPQHTGWGFLEVRLTPRFVWQNLNLRPVA